MCMKGRSCIPGYSHVVVDGHTAGIMVLKVGVCVQAMTKNKETLKAALEPLKNKLSSSSFLTSDSLALADILYMADLRPAFEKVRPASCTYPEQSCLGVS